MSWIGIAFVVMLFFAGAIVGGIYESAQVDNSALNTVVNFQVLRETEVSLIFTSFTVPLPNPDFFSSLGSLMAWNSSLWNGWASYLRIGILLSLTVGAMTTIMLAVFGARLGR